MFSGFGSNNNNTNNNTSSQSGGLFGKPSTGFTGFSLGNSSTTQNNGTSFGASSGGLFGNNTNTNNTASNGQSTSGGLFGNKTTTNNTSSPGGLFGNSNNTNSTTTGGLFGNNSNNNSSSTGGLFGNSNNNNSSTGSSLFGSKPSTTTQSTGLSFGTQQNGTASSGLFKSSSNPSQSGSLFGNNTNQSNGLQSTSFQNNNTPSIQTKQYNINDLPKPLTNSTKAYKVVHGSTNVRKRSLSNTSSTSIPVPRSSILERLGRVSGLRSNNSYDSEGLFTSKNDLIQPTSPEKQQDSSRNVVPRNFSQSTKSIVPRSIRPRNDFSSDYLRLKVDSSRSDARRLKLFGSSGGAQKVRILGREDEPQIASTPVEEVAEPKVEDVKEEKQVEPEEVEGKESEKTNTENGIDSAYFNADGYWCSPSISELSKLPLRQLAEISGFSIGRKGYGSINFELPVDLTAFWSDLQGQLFGGVVRFNKNKTVEVYPNGSVPLGTGLNVPATITLENVYPISKSKSQDQAIRNKEISLFVKKLKELKDMQFVTYDPTNGTWTFKVKHFSIWGLVDEDAAVVDVDTENSEEEHVKSSSQSPQLSNIPVKLESKKSRSLIEDTFIYKRQRESNTADSSIIMPGSFIADDSLIIREPEFDSDSNGHIGENLLSEDDHPHEDILEPVIRSTEIYQNDDTLPLDAPNDEDVDEKQFEPEDVDVDDLNILEADPKLAVDDDWNRQLELASQFDSAFSSNSFTRTTVHEGPFSKSFTPGELDKLLYGDFEKVVKSQNKIKSELRLSNYNFAAFTSSNDLLQKDSFSTSTTTIKSISSLFTTTNKELVEAVYKKYFELSSIVTRPNGLPKVLPNNKLDFKFITETFEELAIQEQKEFWNLASVLFDHSTNGTDLDNITDVGILNRILDIKRREDLLDWIKTQTQSELERKFEETSDPFEQIFLLLVTFEISNAAKLAIKTKNPHLSALISLLGSNDPEVKYSATKQVEYWKKNAVLHTIPEGLLKIYYLLQGNILSNDSNIDVSKDLSWKARLGLLAYYGNLNDSISTLISTFAQDSRIDGKGLDGAFLSLLRLYVHKYEGKFDIQHVLSDLKSSTKWDAFLQWFIFEVLVRSTNQVGLGSSNADIGDRLTKAFAEQLVADGLYEEAIFTLSHLSNDEEAKASISRIINVHIQDFVEKPDFLDRFTKLKVPKQLILEAKALYYRYTNEPWNEAAALLDAENFEEAHNTIISRVAPSAVINNGTKLDELLVLINRFPEQFTSKSWATGLAVYKNYIKFIKTGSDAPLRYLIANVPLVRQSNPRIKIAVRLISKSIAQRLVQLGKKNDSDYFGLSAEKILKLPLGEDHLFFNRLLIRKEYSSLHSYNKAEVQ